MTKEERYIKIDTCKKCNFSGHSSNGKEFIFICSNPIHKDIETQKIRIGDKFFPITAKGKNHVDNLIPKWCKLLKV
ncbi:hypothetical protein KKH23_05540 [Patescibacteria group bacterium]|nr:hypothetical protein [Patescibacteria group bacterium]MBU0846634.1 hypothetical protein [Patescibacteria group bacterium]